MGSGRSRGGIEGWGVAGAGNPSIPPLMGSGRSRGGIEGWGVAGAVEG